MLVSLVVKQAVGQGSSNLYVLVFPQDLMPGQYHLESLEYQVKNCYVQRQRLVHLFGESEGLVAQINTFEHLCHVKTCVLFHPQVFSLQLLQHYEVCPAKKKVFKVSPVFSIEHEESLFIIFCSNSGLIKIYNKLNKYIYF